MWVSSGLMVIVALLHTWFMVLETFLWTHAATIKRFGMTKEYAEASAKLAANQGLYNLFLAAGLIFALANRQSDLYTAVGTFFLACVIVAGIFGGVTVGRQILLVQAMPATLALIALHSGI